MAVVLWKSWAEIDLLVRYGKEEFGLMKKSVEVVKVKTDSLRTYQA